MRNFNYVIICLTTLLIVIISACSEDTTTPAPYSDNHKVKEYFPGRAGDWWIYLVIMDSSGVLRDTLDRDSVYFNGSTSYKGKKTLIFETSRYHYTNGMTETFSNYYSYDNSKLWNYDQFKYDNKIGWHILCDLDKQNWMVSSFKESEDRMDTIFLGETEYKLVHYQSYTDYKYETVKISPKKYTIDGKELDAIGFESTETFDFIELNDGDTTTFSTHQVNKFIRYFVPQVGLVEFTIPSRTDVQDTYGKVSKLIKYNVKK